MNIYKTFEELKEELGDEYDKFMYEMNLELVKQKEKEQQELERYKNIVDELEKWLNENIDTIHAYFENTPFGVEDTYKEVLNKLKELKGSDS